MGSLSSENCGVKYLLFVVDVFTKCGALRDLVANAKKRRSNARPKRLSNQLECIRSISLNPFVWHSNFYMRFNHSHDMYITLE